MPRFVLCSRPVVVGVLGLLGGGWVGVVWWVPGLLCFGFAGFLLLGVGGLFVL